MKNRNIFLLLLAVIFGVVGCQKSDREKYANLERIVVDIDQMEEETDGNFLIDTTNIEVIALETNEECLIGDINKVQLRGDKILVYDKLTLSVFVFNRDGSYYSKIHALGEGPGEYPPVVNDVVIMDSLVGFLVPVIDKIILYNFDGKYKGDISLRGTWGYSFFTFDNDHYFMINDGGMTDQGTYRLFSFNLNNDKINHFLPFKIPDKVNRGWMLENYYSLYNNRALIIYCATDVIYEITPGEEPVPLYYVDIVKNKLPQELADGDGRKALEASIRSNYLTGMTKIYETCHHIILDISNKFRVVYDKEQKKVISTAKIFSLDGVGGFPIISSSYSTIDNGFIINELSAEIAPFFYKNGFNEKTLKNKAFAKKYAEAVKKLTDSEDNPLLIIFKAKQ